MAKKIKKKELGKGIRALLSNMESNDNSDSIEEKVEEVVIATSSVSEIPVNAIEVNPFQPRKDFDEAALEDLANSLKVHGLIQPITVRRLDANSYQLISGERRWRASQRAGIESVPAYVRTANDQEMLEMALVENIQREQLNAIEVAITYQRLIDECNLTHEGLSDRVGKNRSSVTNYLRLLKLPPDIQKALKNKTISMGHARALVGIEEIDLLLSVFNQVRAEQLSVRATEELVRSYAGAKAKKKITSPAAAGSLSPEHKTVEENLRSHLGTKVRLKANSKGRGQIIIPFSSDKELNRLLDLLED